MITNAYQKGNTVYIYNERGAQSASIMVARSKQSGLRGFTGQTVSIQQGNSICTYNEKGYEVGSPISAGVTETHRQYSGSGNGKLSIKSRIVLIILVIALYFIFVA